MRMLWLIIAVVVLYEWHYHKEFRKRMEVMRKRAVYRNIGWPTFSGIIVLETNALRVFPAEQNTD